MTDLELLDFYADHCSPFIDPRIFRHVKSRGLVWAVYDLPKGIEAKKSIIRARLSQTGQYTGDPVIEKISGVIDRIKETQKEIQGLKPTDVEDLFVLGKRLNTLSAQVINFMK